MIYPFHRLADLHNKCYKNTHSCLVRSRNLSMFAEALCRPAWTTKICSKFIALLLFKTPQNVLASGLALSATQHIQNNDKFLRRKKQNDNMQTNQSRGVGSQPIGDTLSKFMEEVAPNPHQFYLKIS